MSEEPTPHPAPYSAPVLTAMFNLIEGEAERLDVKPSTLKVLDPMAGIGRVHDLPGDTTGVEIEPEWASQRKGTRVGDATDLPSTWTDRFDVIAVSPAYGNRMSDHHDAKDGSRRISYRHLLGRMPTEGSSGVMSFTSSQYRELHVLAWFEAKRVLKPGGLFLLNVADFIAGGSVVLVAEWHLSVLFKQGFRLEGAETVTTRKMRFGANRNNRVPGELVCALRAP